MPRILSVSSSRADVSILRPVWQALAERPDCELHVLTTGMHRAKQVPDVDLPARAIRHSGGEDLGGRSAPEAARGMIACATAAAEVLARVPFDCLVLMGDRLDMLPTGYASLPFQVPIAHIHGGELSYGAIDDRVRHAITKLAHLHFASCCEAAERLVQMGEEPWRVHVIGAPGLDTLRHAPEMSREDFVRTVGLPSNGPFLLATVHPETNASDPAAPMTAVLEAIDACKLPVLITATNSDPDGMRLRAMAEAFLARYPKAVFRETLGGELYANALRHAAAMVGNSSSGVIEAGLFGLPVVNVGNRQAGRLAGSNVRHVANDAAAVTTALRAIVARNNRFPSHTPYGDGASAERIVSVLANLPDKNRLLYKVFNERAGRRTFAAPWESSAVRTLDIPAAQTS